MSSAAVKDRVRIHRQRRREGKTVIPFVVLSDVDATAEMLVASGLLDRALEDDPAALAEAVGKMIDAFAEKHKLELTT